MAESGPDLIERLTRALGFEVLITRRGFIRATAGSVAGLTAVGALARAAGGQRLVIIENADGVLVADATRCVGCRRCELACTEYLDGRAQPSLARVRVGRNYNFGPRGQQAGVGRSAGEFGDLRIIVDACMQCPHPVPCATACPNDAIVLDPKTRARIVDPARCEGCRLCLPACPWEMIAFDESTEKATKCHLCGGSPVCVEACPASALRYVSWRDLTRAVPVRLASPPVMRDYESAGCTSCHRTRR